MFSSKKRLVSLCGILETGFLNYRKFIIRALNVVLSVYRSEENLEYSKEEVDKAWDFFEAENEHFEYFVSVFCDFNPEKSLLAVKKGIEAKSTTGHVMPSEFSLKQPSDPLLSILEKLADSDNDKTCLELLFEVLKRDYFEIGDVAYILKNAFGIKRHSENEGFKVQKDLLDFFCKQFLRRMVSALGKAIHSRLSFA
jgi:hypothetical protein